MIARNQSEHPMIDHDFAVITSTVDGTLYNHLPGASLSLKLLKTEVALSKAILLLNESPTRTKEIKDTFSEAFADFQRCARRSTKLPNGETQYWELDLGRNSADTADNRCIDGQMFKPMTAEAVRDEQALFKAHMVKETSKPYLVAGKAFLYAFRLLAAAAPKYFESRTAFMKRQGLMSDFKNNLQIEFERYLFSCQESMTLYGMDPNFKATFNRFTAVWVSSPAPAQTEFILALYK